MAHVWTEEKLLALAPAGLEKLRANAVAKGVTPLAEQIAAIQLSRKPPKKLTKKELAAQAAAAEAAQAAAEEAPAEG